MDGFTPPHPTIEVLWDSLWVAGVLEPVPEAEIPRLAWHLEQSALARVLGPSEDPESVFGARNVRRGGEVAGVTHRVFLLRPNRHGRLRLRRNSELVSEEVARVYEAVVEVAVVWVLHPGGTGVSVPGMVE